MPVNELHPQYLNRQYEVRQMRDTIAGPSNVKRSGSLYLPIPTSMFINADVQPPTGISIDGNDLEGQTTNIVSNAPWQHEIPAYQSFLQRARFPDTTNLIQRGLLGVAVKIDPVFELPSKIEYLRDRATRGDKSLVELFEFMVSEVLSVGRVSLLVDVDDTLNRLVIVPFVAESLINWKEADVKDDRKFTLSVLAEGVEQDDRDEFSHDVSNAFRVLRLFGKLDEEVVQGYNTQLYIDETPKEEPVFPMLRGTIFPEIPLSVANVSGTGITEWTCPLVGVSDITISIYQKDADMSNAEFLTCNPMLVFTGVDSDNDELPDIIGSNVTWSLPDSESKAFYVEPEANCLAHMVKRVENLFNEAVQYGVSILGDNTSSGEAAETVKMRQQGNSSNLRTIIKSCANALEDALTMCLQWESNSMTPGETVSVKPNLELTEATLTAQEQTALLQAWLNGGISHNSYLSNLQNSGIELVGETPEGERDLIDTEAPELDDDLGDSNDDLDNSNDEDGSGHLDDEDDE